MNIGYKRRNRETESPRGMESSSSQGLTMDQIVRINAGRYFQSGGKRPEATLRPWQYIDMEYRRLGLTPPAYIPPLETVEDAEIWMLLDTRVNHSLRMKEQSLAG